MKLSTFHLAQHHSGAPADTTDSVQPELCWTAPSNQIPERFQDHAGRETTDHAADDSASHAASEESQPDEDSHHIPFELFKSNVCHRLKALGDTGFVMELLRENTIRRFFEEGSYRECLYLLGMLDYISRLNGIPLCNTYADLRQYKLPEPIYPASILCLCHARQSEEPKEQALREAIPEFLRFNIVESEVRNVF